MVTLRLTWPANPPEDLVSSYQVLESFNGSPFSVTAEVPTPTYDKLSPTPGQWAFKVTAKNFVGIGPESDPVAGPGVPSKPGTPTLSVITT
jgi:hypothetical protein